MRILIATDAWRPQVNGVVRSLESVSRALREFGTDIEFLTPQGFATVPLPTYAEIRLALVSRKAVAKRLNGAAIDHIHIATEGPHAIVAAIGMGPTDMLDDEERGGGRLTTAHNGATVQPIARAG
jgi:hypothetical protein